MNSPTTFSRIESSTNDAGTVLRTIHFVALDTTARLPDELQRRSTDANSRSIWVARARAATELSTADVADAASSFHPRLVAEWLYDRGEPFTLSRLDRRALREAGLPLEVIEAMHSLSAPDRAALERKRNLSVGSTVALGKAPRHSRGAPGPLRPDACAEFAHLKGIGCAGVSPGGWNGSASGWNGNVYFVPPFPLGSGENPPPITVTLPKP